MMISTILKSKKEEDQIYKIELGQGRNLMTDINQGRNLMTDIRRMGWKPINQGVTLIRGADIVSIRTLVLVRKIFVILLIMTMCVD